MCRKRQRLEVRHQRRAERRGTQPCETGVAAQRLPAGELSAGPQHRGSAGHTAEEQIQADRPLPRRRLHHRTAAVAVPVEFGHPTVGTIRSAARLDPLRPLSLRSLSFRLPDAPGRGGRNWSYPEPASSTPVLPRTQERDRRCGHSATASPARLYMVGRSLLALRGSGGSPYTPGSSSSRNTEPVPHVVGRLPVGAVQPRFSHHAGCVQLRHRSCAL